MLLWKRMPIFSLTEELSFPSPELSEPDGLLAIGGDLSINRLLLSYYEGIFPWYSNDDPILWWSPDPRFILYPSKLKISKSLKRTLKQNKFEVRFDQKFSDVIVNCSQSKRKGQSGTWITSEMESSYIRLHEQGFAHSAESYLDGELVGGLYGVSIGSCFFGESMFTDVSDASKVAFASLVLRLIEKGFELIDCQVQSKHLASLGAEDVPRKIFLELLYQYRDKPSWVGKWTY